MCGKGELHHLYPGAAYRHELPRSHLGLNAFEKRRVVLRGKERKNSLNQSHWSLDGFYFGPHLLQPFILLGLRGNKLVLGIVLHEVDLSCPAVQGGEHRERPTQMSLRVMLDQAKAPPHLGQSPSCSLSAGLSVGPEPSWLGEREFRSEVELSSHSFSGCAHLCRCGSAHWHTARTRHLRWSASGTAVPLLLREPMSRGPPWQCSPWDMYCREN